MLTKKTSRQPRVGPPSAISAPPTSGPIAVPSPTVVPRTPKARPRSAPWNICWISPDVCGLIRPPNSPWSTRAAIRKPAVGARPESAEVTTKPPTPTWNISRRPWSSPSLPPSTGTSPNASV